MLKEVAHMGGDLTSMVPENVAKALRRKVLDKKLN
jgi:phosphopantetheine adenylyltransferase